MRFADALAQPGLQAIAEFKRRSPSAGDIRFQNHSIRRLPAYQRARLGIGRTFQIMRPFPGLKVLDNVAVGALFGKGKGESNLERAREEACRLWGQGQAGGLSLD